MLIQGFDTARRVLVVAEIGNNHEGRIDVARELVQRAAEAGADAVKFQTFHTEHYVSASDRDRFERLKSFELTDGEFRELARLAGECGLMFLSTPFDLASARFLDGLVGAFKIASCDNTFMPLIETVAATGKPILLSTGLATLDELRAATAVIHQVWAQRGCEAELGLLHCVSCYPVSPAEANLGAIRHLERAFGCTVGYSDHTLGIEAAALSVAAGARIVEKHFTLDKSFSPFRDHQLSADPPELAELVGRIRSIETLLGDGHKRPQPGERAAMVALRRSIVARRDLAAGSRVAQGDITWVRPGGGIPPGRESEVVGQILTRDVEAGQQILPEMLAEPAMT